MSEFPTDKLLADMVMKEFERDLHLEDERIFFSIGVSLTPMPHGVKASAPYAEKGRELWNALHHELYELFCDSTSSEPKEWVSELIEGDTRNLLTGILSAISARVDLTLGIAVPVAALIVKNRARSFCAARPVLTGRTSHEIVANLKERQAHVEAHNKTRGDRPKRKGDTPE